MATQNPAQLAAARKQVEEVQDIMRTNVEKVMERDGKLGDLSQRAEDLEVGTAQFKTAANRIQRKHFWENMKMKIIVRCRSYINLYHVPLLVYITLML